jgi:hypothetical protein
VADLGEIARAVGEEYLHVRRTTPWQRKALRAVQRCRTAAMGSVFAVCDHCGAEHPLFRSCRNRNCPGCQSQARKQWLEARQQELLPVPYFHVVFTVPEILNRIALYCPEVFYAALLRAAGNALLDVGRSKLGAQLGCLALLHTWGQNLSLHPHAHCIVPGGGFSLDGKRWVSVRNPSYLLPVKVLALRFRTVLTKELRMAERAGKLSRVPGAVRPSTMIQRAAAHKWVVYAKPPFGTSRHVLEYLSRYTHRVAIGNSRIVSFQENKVTFKWRDYRDGNRVKLMTLDAIEFLRRFLTHVLPPRFVKIRYFGFMGNRRRTENIRLARTLLGAAEPVCVEQRVKSLFLCPACHAAARRQEPTQGVPFTVSIRPPPQVLSA